MANKDLFKQAIAEAKSIREAAITNAKEALEETLTPHLKDMLAAKLQEMEDSTVEEVVTESEEVEEEVTEAQDEQLEEAEYDVAEGDYEKVEEAEEEADDAEGDSEESEDDAIENEEDEEEVEVKDMEVDDLKNLIRDIISQEMGDDTEELDNADMDAGEEMGDIAAAGSEEEIDLDELLAELEATNEETLEEEEVEEAHCNTPKEEGVEEEISEDNSELNEALSTIGTLQSQLQEVNLLNAKLMYVNKVFKANNLNESQKVNIIAAFDKAETVKEVKLVFETVSESIVVKKPSTTIKESKLGMASKATGTTASKPEVINEVSDAVRRMQKLAGIITN